MTPILSSSKAYRKIIRSDWNLLNSDKITETAPPGLVIQAL